MKNENIVTIQKTSKKLKLALVICRLGYVVTVVMLIMACANPTAAPARPAIAMLIFIVSVIAALVTRFLIWWNHG